MCLFIRLYFWFCWCCYQFWTPHALLTYLSFRRSWYHPAYTPLTMLDIHRCRLLVCMRTCTHRSHLGNAWNSGDSPSFQDCPHGCCRLGIFAGQESVSRPTSVPSDSLYRCWMVLALPFESCLCFRCRRHRHASANLPTRGHVAADVCWRSHWMQANWRDSCRPNYFRLILACNPCT